VSQRSAISLWDRHAQQLVPATLVDALDTGDVIQAALSWRPLIEARIQKLLADGIPRSQWPEHLHWDWEAKASAVAGLLAYQIMGIECEGALQGMMLAATVGKVCHIPSQAGRPLVYIHFLATAPWNDMEFVDPPRFGLVGKVFLAAAIQLSRDNGFRGRVGLHSLPQAEPFYHSSGMTDLGIDPNGENLRYFEMTPAQAQTFLP